MKYSYSRISTQKEEQTFDRQISILKQFDIPEENCFQERISGGVKTTSRKEWDKLLEVVKSGDMIYVTEMSRLSRSLQDLIETVNYLIDKNVGITFIKENIVVGSDGMSAMNKLMFSMFGAFAEFEKSLISERVKQGLQAKKENGIVLGRPTKMTEAKIEEFKKLYNEGHKIVDLSAYFGMTKQNILNLVKKLGLPRRNKPREKKC